MTYPWSPGEILTSTDLNGAIPKSTGEVTADSTGPTSAAASLAVNSMTLTTPAVDGRCHVWGTATFTKTVSSDVFELSVFVEGSAVGRVREGNGGGDTVVTLSPNGSVALSPSDGSVAISLNLLRISGSGTATVGVTTPNAQVHAIFIPS